MSRKPDQVGFGHRSPRNGPPPSGWGYPRSRESGAGWARTSQRPQRRGFGSPPRIGVPKSPRPNPLRQIVESARNFLENKAKNTPFITYADGQQRAHYDTSQMNAWDKDAFKRNTTALRNSRADRVIADQGFTVSDTFCGVRTPGGIQFAGLIRKVSWPGEPDSTNHIDMYGTNGKKILTVIFDSISMPYNFILYDRHISPVDQSLKRANELLTAALNGRNEWQRHARPQDVGAANKIASSRRFQ